MKNRSNDIVIKAFLIAMLIGSLWIQSAFPAKAIGRCSAEREVYQGQEYCEIVHSTCDKKFTEPRAYPPKCDCICAIIE